MSCPATIDCHLTGECAAATLGGLRFERIGEESEAAMLARAEEATGLVDTLIWISWKQRAPRQ